MTTFMNYNKGQVSILHYRLPGAVATDMQDVIDAFQEQREEILTAAIDVWIKDQLNKITLNNLTREEAENYVFGEKDFLDKTIEGIFGLSMHDYPELRDYQWDFIAAKFA